MRIRSLTANAKAICDIIWPLRGYAVPQNPLNADFTAINSLLKFWRRNYGRTERPPLFCKRSLCTTQMGCGGFPNSAIAEQPGPWEPTERHHATAWHTHLIFIRIKHFRFPPVGQDVLRFCPARPSFSVPVPPGRDRNDRRLDRIPTVPLRFLFLWERERSERGISSVRREARATSVTGSAKLRLKQA